MRFETATSPYIHDSPTVAQLMRRVLYAVLPGVAVLVWLFGGGVLIHMAIASVVALAAEAFMLAIRGKSLKVYLSDGSALVTAWLLAISLSPVVPWWLTALGTAFAIIVAKHLYGGLGYNPFNPAMIGYVALLISFPREMSIWPPLEHDLSFLDLVHFIFTSQLPDGMTLDALSGATPLDTLKMQLGMGKSMAEIRLGPVLGMIAGRDWEWISLAFLAGGLWLVYTRTAAWQIPAGMLGGMALIAGVFYAVAPQAHPSPWFHVFSVSSIFGAFFIATDPVSASATPWGRLIFGAGIGVLVYIIRTFGGYPDAVAFAVLLMNIAAPTIDYYTQPRVFGAHRG